MISRLLTIGVAIVLAPLAGFADEPGEKLRIVTPRDDQIVATGINDHGDMVGFQWVENQKLPGVIDQAPILARGKSITSLPLLAGYTATFPAAISDDGIVVGRAGKPAPRGEFVPLRNQAFLWDAAGGMRPLGVLEGDTASFASDITRDGKRISGFSVGAYRVRACYWEQSGAGWKATALPQKLQLGANTVPMSDNGRWLAAVDGEKPCVWSQSPSGQWTHQFIGDPGEMVPRGVNDSGMVVGVRFGLDGLTHAMIWSQEKGMARIPLPAGYIKAEANAVNNASVVVGLIDGPASSKVGPNAFVYVNNRLRIITEGGPNFVSAVDINNHSQIAGVFEKAEEEEKPAEPVKASKP